MSASARPLTDSERSLVARLLEKSFEGAEELRAQLPSVRMVRPIEDEATIQFLDVQGPVAAVSHRIPTEGEVQDLDGTTVHILLHVVDGKLHELELYKDDGSSLLAPVSADSINVL